MRPGTDREHKARTSIVLAVACAAVIALSVVVAVSQGRRASSPRTTAPQPTQAASGNLLHVVQGRTITDGVRLGYPHTLQGAVSAADEFMSDIGSTLDPDRAAAILRLTADPSYPQAPDQFAQGVITNRQALGLPLTGPVPDDTSALLEPIEYQVKNATPDQVTVLLLADYTVTAPGQGIQGRISIDPLDMHWAVGDWKILPPETTVSYASLLVQPDSAQAAADGWQELSP